MIQLKRYQFNPNTFQYERITLSPKDVLSRVGFYALGGLIMSLLFLAVTLRYVGNLEEYFLSQDNTELNSQLGSQQLALSTVEIEIDKIHEQDNSFYRSILQVDRIDPSIWNAGVGGAEPTPGQPEQLVEFERAKSAINYKIEKQQSSFEELMLLAIEKKDELQHIPAIRPINTGIVSGFGYRANPFHGHTEFHAGLDFRAPIGTPIRASGNGKVIEAGMNKGGYGIQVELDHGYGYITKYAHMSKLNVKVGQEVKRGEVIGYVGSTGYSTGPHLHYEVIKKGEKSNPMDYFYVN